MFSGYYVHDIDNIGRMIMQNIFRESLGEVYVKKRGHDHCLIAYPMDEWKQLEEKLKKLPLTKKDARSFTRFFFSGAVECEVDKQGRINIPSPLRTYSKLDKECVVIGVSNRIEVWAKEI